MLYVDDIVVPDVLTQKVLDILAVGGDPDPWYLFLEKCRQNPWRDAINEFYQLMDRWSTPITTDGDMVFCKSVRGDYYDRHTGTIRYTIGEVIADQKLIDNPKLTDASRAACSNGLHFGPWAGAKTYTAAPTGGTCSSPSTPGRDQRRSQLPKGRALKMRVIDDVPQGVDWADKVGPGGRGAFTNVDAEHDALPVDPDLAAIINEETRSHRSRPARKASTRTSSVRRSTASQASRAKTTAKTKIVVVQTKWAITKDTPTAVSPRCRSASSSPSTARLAALARHFGISQGTVQATKTKLGL